MGQDEKTRTDGYSDNGKSAEYREDQRQESFARSSRGGSISAAERARRNLNAKLANPLSGYSQRELKKMGWEYAMQHALAEPEDVRAFELGAILAQDPKKYDQCPSLTDEELKVLEKEFSSKWAQPKLLYLVVVLCSTCAAVQGMGR